MSKHKFNSYLPHAKAVTMLQDRPFGKVAVSMTQQPIGSELPSELVFEVGRHSPAVGMAQIIPDRLSQLSSAKNGTATDETQEAREAPARRKQVIVGARASNGLATEMFRLTLSWFNERSGPR